MAQASSIEWTESTWNPVVGCRKVSEGCRNCYAERMAKRLAAIAAAARRDGRTAGRTANYMEVVNDRGLWNGSVYCDDDAVEAVPGVGEDGNAWPHHVHLATPVTEAGERVVGAVGGRGTKPAR